MLKIALFKACNDKWKLYTRSLKICELKILSTSLYNQYLALRELIDTQGLTEEYLLYIAGESPIETEVVKNV